MRDDPGVAFLLEADRRHQAAAGMGAVPGMDVDMFAGQAMRAMIGIAVARHRCATLRTGEVFNCPLKFSVIHAERVSRRSPENNIDII